MQENTVAMINSCLPFILMGGVFYFMLWRPQKQQQNKRNQMLNSLKKGDRVVTIGGLYGTITDITERKVTLQVAENVEMCFMRSAISSVVAVASLAAPEVKDAE